MVILLMSMIFFFSSQNSGHSSAMSGFIRNIVIRVFHPDFDSLTLSEQEMIMSDTGFIIRKLGHFTEFALLGASLMIHAIVCRVCGTNKASNMKFLLPHSIIVLLIGALYAGTDEFHQGFVAGRVPALADVGIDSLGVAFGLLIVMAVYMSRHLYKN